MNDINFTKARNIKLSTEFNWIRWGLLGGIVAVTLSSAAMNISGWISMAATPEQALANGLLSGGMELTALCALPFAGFMMQRRTYGKATLALLIAGVAVAINIYATENFLHGQADTLINAIEMSGATLDQINDQIAGLEQERASIIERNDGVPRDVETIERAYAPFDPESNPINMRNKASEIGDRLRYEELMDEIETLRDERSKASVTANDTARSVIPEGFMRSFVIALELMKATGLYIIGNSTLFLGAKARKDYENRKKWAIIKLREQQRIEQSPK